MIDINKELSWFLSYLLAFVAITGSVFIFIFGYFDITSPYSYVLIGILLLSFIIITHQTILQYKNGKGLKIRIKILKAGKEKTGKENAKAMTEKEKRKIELKKRIMKIKEAEREARKLERDERIKLNELKRKRKEEEKRKRLEEKIRRRKERDEEKRKASEEKEKLTEDKKLAREQEKLKKLMSERERIAKKEELFRPEAKKEEKEEKKPAIEAIKKLVKSKGEYETDLDILLGLVEKYGELRILEITKIFGISKEKAEEWGKILEGHGLLKIYYPAIGEPRLRRIR